MSKIENAKDWIEYLNNTLSDGSEVYMLPSDREMIRDALVFWIENQKEENMKGYVYVIYVGNNTYKIGKTAYLEQRFNQLKEERLVRLIKAENITRVEGQLHKRFSNKRITSSQELFRLNDQDILHIQMLSDEWEDESRIF